MHGIDKVQELPKLGIDGKYFIDSSGRKVILRGVNLAGISIPYKPNGATHLNSEWNEESILNASWKNRPFSKDEFDEHFIRLRVYGFNCLRVLVSWEAIEHAGPYQYDEEFLSYITDLIRAAGEWGFYVYINFHQDVWSRVTGGDGHPIWLFDKVGLDWRKFHDADLALTMQEDWDPETPHDTYERLSWSYNSRLFPVSTMWTLFWAGKEFAPKMEIKDEKTGSNLNVQTYMQKHYFEAVEVVAKRVRHLKNVIGFNPINEPSKGYLGKKVSERPGVLNKKAVDGTLAEPGIAWSPLDGMAVASGLSRTINCLGISLVKGLKTIGTTSVNPNQVSVWKPDAEPIWLSQGVWDIENDLPIVKNDDYFRILDDREIDFTRDYLIPFHIRAAHLLHNYNPDWFIIVENDPSLNGSVTVKSWPTDMPQNAVNGFHWYDLAQLGLKKWLYPFSYDLMNKRLVFGKRGIQKMYEKQLSAHVQNSEDVNDGDFPIIVGEFGIAMDMDDKKAYEKWASGNNENNWRTRRNKAFRKHERILNLIYNSFDKLQLSSTQWNYAPYNDNEFGDRWNLEDLSIYSKDQEVEPFEENKYSGSRGLAGFCRTYAMRIPGDPIKIQFNWRNGEFILEYFPDPEIEEPGVIFAPYVQYPHGYHMKCVGGARAVRNLAEERIYLYNTDDRKVFFIMFRHDAFWI